jgi:hypothetical protein
MRSRLVIALILVLQCRPQERPVTEAGRIRQVIASYAAAVDTADVQFRETQIYGKAGSRWLLVHVHYSQMPAGG